MNTEQGFTLHPGAAQDITDIWEFIVEDTLWLLGCTGRHSPFASWCRFRTKDTRCGRWSKLPLQCDSEPSRRTGLLPSSPLRTVHESFLSHSSSPSNASFGETRFRDRKVLAVNPVMALRMQ
jgi:hypothetical protein